MKINELTLKNHQVIREVSLTNLRDFVVIAGPNGVGKTKIKDAICYVFQNGGNPPPGSPVLLEATNDEERTNWGGDTVQLPNTSFWSYISRSRKKIKTRARLIQIDSSRQVETISFQQINFAQIGNPEEETTGHDYGYMKVSDRFKDICFMLQREKIKLITDYGLEAHTKLTSNERAELLKKIDPTQKFEDIFHNLLYPKKMVPIRHDSSTIQYYDENNEIRSYSELSSGEKEVIVLAFDVLLQNPSDCVILIDEPELHLHPELSFRLVKVLKSIGERNQIFLFTHSTDIISNSFETGVYFIRPRSKVPQGNQTRRVDLENIDDLLQIPNLRNTIGMLSLGKKLLFVEGINTSIDRNVFATLAKSFKSDLAIIPSESCQNITNLANLTDILQKGIFGIELYMVRDRDSLTEEEISTYSTKSGNRLIFLPYYHIENAFLIPEAIFRIQQKLRVTKQYTVEQIKGMLKESAALQINRCVSMYVASEIRFKAGNFDTTIDIRIEPSTPAQNIATAIIEKKNLRLKEYSSNFSDAFIQERVAYWKQKLEDSLAGGWSEEARKLFYGKALLNQLQQKIFGTKRISLWEHIINDDNPSCVNAIKELRQIIDGI